MRQGNDVGTQYRSAIYTTTPDQLAAATHSATVYAPAIAAAGYGPITTEMAPLGPFYYAEPAHQQYLAANPNGYRCHSASGVPYPG
jgi:peptide-methionine (S)-S-oxide reductase